MAGAGLDSRQFKRLLSSAVMWPLLLALILSTILLVEVFSLLSFHRWLEHTDHVLRQAYELERLLADQESGRRGYFLTSDEQFLDRYNASVPLIPPTIDRLLSSVTENSAEVQRIQHVRELYGQWSAYAADTVAMKRQGQDVTAIVASGKGKQLADEMRSDLNAVIAQEHTLRLRRRQATTVASWVLLGSAALMIVLLGVLFGMMIRRRVSLISESYTDSMELLDQRTAALNEVEDRYRRLVELSPDGVFIQVDGKWEYLNQALLTMLGAASEHELLGKPIMDIIHPDDRDRVRERIRQLKEEVEQVPLIEERFVRLDGMPVWVEVISTRFQYHGKMGVQGVVRDITARVESEATRKRLEAERQELLEKLQLILERMPIACMLNDPQYRFTYWNPAAERMFGFRFDEVRGKPPFGTITPLSVQPVIEQVFRQLADQKEPVFNTGENVTKDGRTILCSWVNSSLRTQEGKFVGILSMAQDITEHRRTELGLVRAQKMAHVGNWEWDVPGDRMRWSDEVSRIVGHTTNEIVGDLDRMQRFIHPDDRTEVVRQTTNLLKHGTPTDMEHRIVRADGTVRWIHSRAEVTRGGDGTPLLIFGTIVDITARKESEEKLRRLNDELERRVAERTAELERLAAELHGTNEDQKISDGR